MAARATRQLMRLSRALMVTILLSPPNGPRRSVMNSNAPTLLRIRSDAGSVRMRPLRVPGLSKLICRLKCASACWVNHEMTRGRSQWTLCNGRLVEMQRHSAWFGAAMRARVSRSIGPGDGATQVGPAGLSQIIRELHLGVAARQG